MKLPKMNLKSQKQRRSLTNSDEIRIGDTLFKEDERFIVKDLQIDLLAPSILLQSMDGHGRFSVDPQTLLSQYMIEVG